MNATHPHVERPMLLPEEAKAALPVWTGNGWVPTLACLRQYLLEPIQAVVAMSQRLLLLAEERDPRQCTDFRHLYEAANKLLHFVMEAADVAGPETPEAFDENFRSQRHELGNKLNHVSMFCQFLIAREKDEFDGALLPDLETIYKFYDDCEQKLLHYRLPAPVAPPARSSMPPELRSNPGNLLIVDDSLVGRQALRQLLEFQGHQISEAENGVRALEMMQEQNFDLVLLDLLMPGLDGFQVLQHLKSHPNMRYIPTLVISGNQDTGSAIRCIELGAEDYLAKPINFLLLQARVNSCLQKRQLRLRELEQFFPPQVAQQLLCKPKLLHKGRKANVTVLFADIRGFSRISEKLGPRKTVKWVSEVLEVLSACVLRHNGVLVDYQGDEVMAMWGAPDAQPDHALLACRAGLEMVKNVAEFDKKWKSIIRATTEVGIGINSGPARVGNIGTHRKFKYGPLGNTVNLASRVQGATKYFKSHLLITGATRKLLRDQFTLRRIATVQVVNIERPVNLYELAPEDHADWREVKPRYEKALELFESGQLKPAAQILGNLMTQYGVQGPELTLLSRTIESLVDLKKYKKIWDLPGK